ncbi:MAG: hypothetical protein ACM31O_03645 [Bacteroidota bacterium]
MSDQAPDFTVTIADAPVHYRADEAEAWCSGHDAGVIAALTACLEIAEQRGGADGLIIAGKIRQLLTALD